MPRSLLLAAALVLAAPGRAAPALAFLEDDWPGALERARASDLPVFVDVWAPW